VPKKSYPFAKNLLAWYDKQGRKNLPWREKITPYRVWISEIMLQQTQVKTVIPYFERFIARFPTVSDLAKASQDEVLHLWTGLGYYARARNLHQAAKKIHTENKGVFPTTLEALQSLSGIGRSTAGAILAIAFNQQATILDGNVKRVLTRFHAVEGVPSQSHINAQLWDIAEKHTPKERTADYTQAIMDLGATLCLRTKPFCDMCPIASGCQAYFQERASEFPTPKPRKSIPVRSVNILIFHDIKNNQVLLEKRPPVGIWGGLWSFPECSTESEIIHWCKKYLSFKVIEMKTMPAFKHVFTHFQLNITPIYISKYEYKNSISESQERIWYCLDEPTELGFSAPVKKLIQHLMKK
jgi:A/G-specific adenine glycosylase